MLSYCFANTYGALGPNQVVLSVISAADQYEHVAATGTTAVEPNPEGVSWNVRKELTRYTSLHSPPDGAFLIVLEKLRTAGRQLQHP